MSERRSPGDRPVVVSIVGGEGTRMYPLTLNEPKPLIPVCNYPTLMRLYEILAIQGCREFIFATKGHENTVRLKESFKYGDGFSRRLDLHPTAIFRYQPHYLDRGSADAVRYCLDYYDVKQDVLIVSGDHILEMDLDGLMAEHRRREALMTICLQRVDSVSHYGVADIDPEMRIRRFVEKPAPGSEPSHLANMGVYVLSPRIREVLRSLEPEAIRDFGKDLIPRLTGKGNGGVYGFIHEGYWNDIGQPGSYLKTTQDILHQQVKSIRFKHPYRPHVWIHPSTLRRFDPQKVDIRDHTLIGGDTTIANGVRIENSCIGDHCTIGEGAVIQGSVVMDFTNVGKFCRLVHCIVGQYSTIGDYSIIDSELPIDFTGGGGDHTPVVGENVTILERSILGPKKRVANIRESHRILATGKFQDLGYDKSNVYFIEKM